MTFIEVTYINSGVFLVARVHLFIVRAPVVVVRSLGVAVVGETHRCQVEDIVQRLGRVRDQVLEFVRIRELLGGFVVQLRVEAELVRKIFWIVLEE